MRDLTPSTSYLRFGSRILESRVLEMNRIQSQKSGTLSAKEAFLTLLSEEELVRWSKELEKYFYSRVRSKEEAEDLSQEVLLNLWNYRVHLRSRKDFVRFVSRMAKNEFIDHLRYMRRHPQSETTDTLAYKNAEGFEVEGREKLSEDNFDTTIIQKLLLSQTLSLLPPKELIAVRLCYIEGFTVQEAADKMKISRDMMYKTLRAAKKRLITTYKNHMKENVR